MLTCYRGDGSVGALLSTESESCLFKLLFVQLDSCIDLYIGDLGVIPPGL